MCCRGPLFQEVLGINIGCRGRVMSISTVVTRRSSPGCISVGCRSCGVGLLLLPCVDACRVHSKRLLAQASISCPLMSSSCSSTIVCARAASFCSHQIEKGMISRGRCARRCARSCICSGCVQKSFVLLANAELFCDPSLDIGFGQMRHGVLLNT